ncbi:MAG: hypothetical protein E6H03_01140 [Bacillati bacterium ANGP1]|uniref:Peptidase M20 dimerisation domain-containing protein n=1 Tax=Candidatus Segetimicrobium genomatis TaxID=2569760 RepID=A0A537JN54_9BACT|nr:MAG: hypothetical protein E6H03_01140 [Terrabacteria group bacterium ANGP1]
MRYLELHIEQGPVLERRGAPLAAVDAIVGIVRISFVFRGEANHAGTTPMEARRDALWGAADLVAAVREMARGTGGRAVGTVGQCSVAPGATNVIPGRADVTVELRSADGRFLDSLRGEAVAAAQACAGRYGLEVEHRNRWTDPPVPLDARVREEIAGAARDLGWPILSMSSWAGHDAKILGAIGTDGMGRCRPGRGCAVQGASAARLVGRSVDTASIRAEGGEVGETGEPAAGGGCGRRPGPGRAALRERAGSDGPNGLPGFAVGLRRRRPSGHPARRAADGRRARLEHEPPGRQGVGGDGARAQSGHEQG